MYTKNMGYVNEKPKEKDRQMPAIRRGTPPVLE
jgi:hypothetical protein